MQNNHNHNVHPDSEFTHGDNPSFGYWKGIEPIAENRAKAEENLYKTAIDRANVDPEDVALEVGCRSGKGLELLADTIGPAALYGVDSSERRIEQARAAVAGANVYVEQADAEDLPFHANMFSKVLSVSTEAAQPFVSAESFINQLGRVVRAGGMVAVASYFTPNRTTLTNIAKLLPAFETGSYNLAYIYSMVSWLRRAGFCDIEFASIGDSVWGPFAGRTKVTPPDGWIKAYERQLLDYYVITAAKRQPRPRRFLAA